MPMADTPKKISRPLRNVLDSKGLHAQRPVVGSATAPVLGVALFALMFAGEAQAYVGPGTGLGALGALLAVVGAVFFAVVGLIWYPFKRLIRLLRAKRATRLPE
jgi:hypothetical protein